MFSKKHGILGINARNLLYIRPYNKKKAIKMADDKIKTKQFLSARGIPVPKLFAILKETKDIEKFDFNSLPCPFVLKPNKGYGGEGIIPIIEKKDDLYISAGTKTYTLQDLKEHIRDILDGRFSISNVSDHAFFEQYIEADEIVGKYSYGGLPDIRVIVHNLIPVMAMLRLPTKESQGKANLHLGACGVGIDIAKGECTHIVHKSSIVDELPENLGIIRGIKIPYWDKILQIASEVQLLTNLGYMAIDLCLDKNSGPVLLEINARAGLAVQIANLAPLRKRLERIQGIKVSTPEKGVRIAQDIFGSMAPKKNTTTNTKQIIGLKETAELIQKNGVFRVNAKINTSLERTVLDKKTAENAKLLDPENYDSIKNILKLKFAIKGSRVTTLVKIKDLQEQEEKLIISSRDLSNFLIDTTLSKKPKKEILTAKKNPDPQINGNIQKNILINNQLIELDKQTKLLYHLKPTNLLSEKEKFLKNNNYNPQFEYPKLKFDPLEIEEKLAKIETDTTALGKMFHKKKQEISLKIQLIEAIDQENFTKISQELYGTPTQLDFQRCHKLIKKIPATKKQKKITVQQAINQLQDALDKYNLHDWKIKIKEDMVAGCLAGKNGKLFVNPNRTFTKQNVQDLIVHEIETHILTAVNGQEQIYTLFNRGFAGYLKTQEGLAVYNVEKQLGIKLFTQTLWHHPCNYHPQSSYKLLFGNLQLFTRK